MGWVSGRATGRFRHSGVEPPHNRAASARQAQQGAARPRPPARGTGGRCLSPWHARVCPRRSPAALHTRSPPASRPRRAKHNARRVQQGRGRAPHLSSLTVSVRPSSSVPWNFSMAACASCALHKRTRPYPCRRAGPAVRALLARHRAQAWCPKSSDVPVRAGPCFCSPRCLQCVLFTTNYPPLRQRTRGLPAAALPNPHKSGHRAGARTRLLRELAAADLRASWQLPGST